MVTTNYARRIGSIISQGINVVVLNGHPDESISARSFRQGVLEGQTHWNRIRVAIDFLFSPVQKDHCQKAFITDYVHALFLVEHRQDLVYA